MSKDEDETEQIDTCKSKKSPPYDLRRSRGAESGQKRPAGDYLFNNTRIHRGIAAYIENIFGEDDGYRQQLEHEGVSHAIQYRDYWVNFEGPGYRFIFTAHSSQLARFQEDLPIAMSMRPKEVKALIKKEMLKVWREAREAGDKTEPPQIWIKLKMDG